jgi:transcriptional/translational regulatory protein YebC/TACO1
MYIFTDSNGNLRENKTVLYRFSEYGGFATTLKQAMKDHPDATAVHSNSEYLEVTFSSSLSVDEQIEEFRSRAMKLLRDAEESFAAYMHFMNQYEKNMKKIAKLRESQ